MRIEYTDRYKKLGLRIAYYRKLKGMKQKDLAEKMGCDTSFVGQIEAVNIPKPISLDTLFRITDALEISVSQLFPDE